MGNQKNIVSHISTTAVIKSFSYVFIKSKKRISLSIKYAWIRIDVLAIIGSNIIRASYLLNISYESPIFMGNMKAFNPSANRLKVWNHKAGRIHIVNSFFQQLHCLFLRIIQNPLKFWSLWKKIIGIEARFSLEKHMNSPYILSSKASSGKDCFDHFPNNQNIYLVSIGSGKNRRVFQSQGSQFPYEFWILPLHLSWFSWFKKEFMLFFKRCFKVCPEFFTESVSRDITSIWTWLPHNLTWYTLS